MAAVPAMRSDGSPERRGGVSPLSVGVVVWLASELMFFAGLFATYYTLRADNEVWPPPEVDLDILRALASTVILLASSLTMHASVRAAERHQRRQALRWLLATFVLTGFHGLHVLGGLVLMVLAAAVVSGSTSRVPVGPTYTVTGYYWHFVDFVWVGVFVTIFLVQ
jgi:cytochrome c oxidase subunit 3